MYSLFSLSSSLWSLYLSPEHKSKEETVGRLSQEGSLPHATMENPQNREELWGSEGSGKQSGMMTRLHSPRKGAGGEGSPHLYPQHILGFSKGFFKKHFKFNQVGPHLHLFLLGEVTGR